MSRSSASASAASPSREARTSAGVERRGPAEAAVEMHVIDPEPVKREIGEAGVEASLRIALQIPDLGARRGASFDPPA